MLLTIMFIKTRLLNLEMNHDDKDYNFCKKCYKQKKWLTMNLISFSSSIQKDEMKIKLEKNKGWWLK